jgi:hypothetical protein
MLIKEEIYSRDINRAGKSKKELQSLNLHFVENKKIYDNLHAIKKSKLINIIKRKWI